MVRKALWEPEGETGYKGDVTDSLWQELCMEMMLTMGDLSQSQQVENSFPAVISFPKKDLLRGLDTPVAKEHLTADARVRLSALSLKCKHEAI